MKKTIIIFLATVLTMSVWAMAGKERTLVISWITDVHFTDGQCDTPGDDGATFGATDKWQRGGADAAERIQIWIDFTNSSNADIAINTGDFVDTGCTKAQQQTQLEVFTSLISNSSTGLKIPMLSVRGNHTNAWGINYDTWTDIGWNEDDEVAFESRYFTCNITHEADADSPPSDKWDENISPPGSVINDALEVFYPTPPDNELAEEGQTNYTIDFNGFRFIVMGNSSGTIAWLEARLLECTNENVPCIILWHYPVWWTGEDTDPISGGISEESAVSWNLIYDAAPTLQAMLVGHNHQGRASITRNGVFHRCLTGSLTKYCQFIIEDIDIVSPGGDPIIITTTTDHGLSNGTTVRIVQPAGGNPSTDWVYTPTGAITMEGSYTTGNVTSRTFELVGTVASDWTTSNPPTEPEMNNESASVTTDTTQDTYALIEIIPFQVWTPYGMKARMKMTGYGYANDSRFLKRKQDFEFDIYGAQ